MGTLYLVGTPIGNLEDITARALRVLGEVDLIAAEDTRRTARLLQHYSIVTPTTSLHEHNEHAKAPRLVARLREGESIALVSDAGMPLVSDPGAELVRLARESGVPVTVIPGPSAIMTALAGAGVSGPFAFLGFPPTSGKGRAEWMELLGRTTEHMAAVFFEAPHRVRRTLAQAADKLGEQPIVAARELTKAFEEWVVQPISKQLDHFSEPRGEFVIVVPQRDSKVGGQDAPDDASIIGEFGDMTNNDNMKPKAAARAIAAKYGLKPSDVYRLAVRDADKQG